MREHFRGVVWPRQVTPEQMKAADGKYRYVIVGMLVTDEPLTEVQANQVVLDGHAAGMADAVRTIQQKEAAIRVGDACSVLCSLNVLVKDDEEE